MSAHVVSKRHIDTLVHCALTGPSDAHGWLEEGGSFSWYHDDRRHELSLHAEVGEERTAAIDLVPPSQLGQLLVNECVASVHGCYPEADPDTGDLPGPCDAYYMGPYVFERPKTSVNGPRRSLGRPGRTRDLLLRVPELRARRLGAIRGVRVLPSHEGPDPANAPGCRERALGVGLKDAPSRR